MKIIIIIPTFNEKENIEILIPSLLKEFKSIKHEMHILVVDDNSPDGTGNKVLKFSEQYNNVHLLCGIKEGLGKAYVRGMSYALQILNADAIMEMDADFSHKPDDVKRLVNELDRYDFIIGSRYVPGGKIPDRWGFHRKLNSKFGNIFARYIAGIRHVKDCTAGFRAIKLDLLRKIDLNAMKADGYCFQVALLHSALLHKATVKEIPVEFVERKSGKSKLGVKDIVEFFIYIWTIRLKSSDTFLRFIIVGFSGLVVNLGLLTILINLGINKYFASPISIQVSIISNFLLNNYWTFYPRRFKNKLLIRGVRFNIVSFLTLFISYTTFVAISLMLPKLSPQFAQFFGIIPGTLINYFLNLYWTFYATKD